jgi:hypothetical protein
MVELTRFIASKNPKKKGRSEERNRFVHTNTKIQNFKFQIISSFVLFLYPDDTKLAEFLLPRSSSSSGLLGPSGFGFVSFSFLSSVDSPYTSTSR